MSKSASCFLVFCFAILATLGTSQVYVQEFCADPFPPTGTGLDTNADGVFATSGEQSNDEFVEIVNAGMTPVNISGWTLADATSVRHTFASGTFLASGGAIVVFGGGSVTNFNLAGAGFGVVASTGQIGLNNAGDTITLRDAAMVIVTSFTYAATGPEDGDGESVTRSPENSMSAFNLHTVVTPGVRHSAGFLNDGVTPYAGLATPMSIYPGNGTDAKTDVGVNGLADDTFDNVHTINAGDFVTFRFFSPMGTLNFSPILGAFMFYDTGTMLSPITLPGDAAGSIWISPSIAEVMFDGFSCVGFLFCPTLLPGGYVTGGQLPFSLSGQGKSVLIQGLVIDPGLNAVNIGVMDAHEIRIL